jgi:purine nucleoside permease
MIAGIFFILYLKLQAIMKSKKLKFNVTDLKIQSFVTSLTSEEKVNLRGGSEDMPTLGVGIETVKICTCFYTCGSGMCSAESGNCC